MKLTHYSFTPLVLDRTRTYEQKEALYSHLKPRGFWVSVDGEHDWKEWCTDESFHLAALDNPTALTLAPDANVLTLTTVAEILAFTGEYGVAARYDGGAPAIDWQRVAGEYDGIIIAPYQWECRYEHHTSWYYGWDCASGCIWNLDALVQSTEREGVEA
jgi:hypothetical protein